MLSKRGAPLLSKTSLSTCVLDSVQDLDPKASASPETLFKPIVSLPFLAKLPLSICSFSSAGKERTMFPPHKQTLQTSLALRSRWPPPNLTLIIPTSWHHCQYLLISTFSPLIHSLTQPRPRPSLGSLRFILHTVKREMHSASSATTSCLRKPLRSPRLEFCS